MANKSKQETKKKNNNQKVSNKPKKVNKPKEELKKEEKIVVEKTTKKEKKANEKLAKERKKEASKKKFVENLKDYDKTTYVVMAFILGIVLTTIVARLMWPDRIAKLKDGTEPVATIDGTIISADDLYEEMKATYSITQLLNNIDETILTDLYKEDDEMNEKVKSQADYYLNIYKNNYGYTEEQFLESNGFSSYDDFTDYLKLSYRRDKYTDDYIKKNISDKDIENYYNDNVYGSINCQHILVATSDDVTEEDAKKKAEEIIKKINDGTSWEDIKKEYKDSTTFEDLGYQEWNASLEESFLTALKELKDNSFSKEPVKTSYGYHVIYRLDQKEKPSLKDSKDSIIEEMIENKKKEDEKISTKALIALREEKGLSFSDTEMNNKYKKYIKENQ